MFCVFLKEDLAIYKKLLPRVRDALLPWSYSPLQYFPAPNTKATQSLSVGGDGEEADEEEEEGLDAT